MKQYIYCDVNKIPSSEVLESIKLISSISKISAEFDHIHIEGEGKKYYMTNGKGNVVNFEKVERTEEIGIGDSCDDSIREEKVYIMNTLDNNEFEKARGRIRRMSSSTLVEEHPNKTILSTKGKVEVPEVHVPNSKYGRIKNWIDILVSLILVSILVSFIAGIVWFSYQYNNNTQREMAETDLSNGITESSLEEFLLKDNLGEYYDNDLLQKYIQVVVNRICRQELGIPSPHVSIGREGFAVDVAAHYNNLKKEIRINEAYINEISGEDIINIAAHEACHWYHHYLLTYFQDAIEEESKKEYPMLIFRDLLNYKEGYEMYIESELNKEKYKEQLVEKDARAFASKIVLKWRKYLNEKER